MLFPHEPYDQSDVISEKKIVKTIPFDTQNGNSIDLNFLKELKKGSYSFIITALDIKKDTITYESQFNLDSKVDIRSKEELFTYKIDSKSNDFVTIEFQSEVPNLYITTRAYENDKKYYFATIQLVNGMGILKFKEVVDVVSSTSCLRTAISKNFGEELSGDCGHCSVCDAKTHNIKDPYKLDLNQFGHDFLETMDRNNLKVSTTIEVLAGSKTMSIKIANLQKDKNYGKYSIY